MLSKQASTIAPSRPKGRARLTLAASSCPKSFDIGGARIACKISANFSFLALQLHWSKGAGAALICHSSNWVTSKSKRSSCGRSKANPPIRSWHSALLESESCTKKTKHEEGTQKTIELNSAQLRHGPMQLGIGNTSWQQRCRCRRRCLLLLLLLVVFGHVRCAIVF